MSGKISILMPFKNAEAYIEPCMSSILRQSYRHWELIAVDDHSTDNSAAIVSRYQKTDARIRLIANPDSGIIHALRNAYAISAGIYITRMDADDLMPEHKLKILMELLVRFGKQHVATGTVQYFSEQSLADGYQRYQNWLNNMMLRGGHYDDIYKECVIPSPAWMVHREDLDRCGAFQSDIYPEDYDLCFRYYRHGIRVVSTSDLVHYWRDHPTRTSRNHPHYADHRFLDLKMKYFLEIDYDPNKELVLWGAGKKAKIIAKHLIAAQVRFHWISNNSKKIGHNLYDQIIKPIGLIKDLSPLHIIVTPANLKDQSDIKNQLAKMHLKPSKDYFMFS